MMRSARALVALLSLSCGLLMLDGCGGGSGGSAGKLAPSSLSPAAQPPTPRPAARFNHLQSIAVRSLPATTLDRLGAQSSVGPAALAHGDLDGDGHLDLISADGTEATVSVLRGRGDGTFDAPLRAPLPAGTAQALVVADLDLDSRLDVAVATSPEAGADGVITVLFGDGTGGFGAQVTVQVGRDPASIAVAPISGAPAPDLVVVERGEHRVRWFPNLGGRAFAAGQVLPAGAEPVFVRSFSDVLPAFVVLDKGGQAAYWFATPGTGSPSSPAVLPTARGPVSATLLDIDREGDLELLVTCRDDRALRVHAISGGVPATQPAATLALAKTPGALAYRPSDRYHANFWTPLLVCPEDDAFLAAEDPYSDPRGGYAFTTDHGPVDIVEADFNEDGYPDCAVANSLSGTISVGLGYQVKASTLVFRAARHLAAGTNPSCAVAAQLDGDSRMDLASTDEATSTVQVFLSSSAARSSSLFPTWFRAPVAHPVGAGPIQLDRCSLRSTGTEDLIVTCRDGACVDVLQGDGQGGFTRASTAVGAAPASTTLGDVNGDGFTDAVVVCKGSGTYQVLLNDKQGSLVAAPGVSVGARPQVAALGDLDGDGVLDLVVGCGEETLPSAGELHWLRGKGDGTFTEVDPTVPSGDRSVFGLAVGKVVTSAPDSTGVWQVRPHPTFVMLRGGGYLYTMVPASPGLMPTFVPMDTATIYRDLSLVDLNADSLPDKIFVSAHLGCVAVITSTGTTQDLPDYAVPPLIPAGREVRSARVADVNGDGRPDLVTASQEGILVVTQR